MASTISDRGAHEAREIACHDIIYGSENFELKSFDRGDTIKILRNRSLVRVRSRYQLKSFYTLVFQFGSCFATYSCDADVEEKVFTNFQCRTANHAIRTRTRCNLSHSTFEMSDPTAARSMVDDNGNRMIFWEFLCGKVMPSFEWIRGYAKMRTGDQKAVMSAAELRKCQMAFGMIHS